MANCLRKITSFDDDNTSLLRICMIGKWPAIDLLAPKYVKPLYRDRRKEHPASWLRALCLALAMREDVESVTVLCDSREVNRTHMVKHGKFSVVFLPKYELRRTDPIHFYLPGRIRMRRWLKKINPHIVHGHGTESECGLIATKSGYVNVVTIQGILAEIDELLAWPKWKRVLAKYLEKKVVSEAAGLIVSSNWSKRWTLRYREDADIKFIPNVVSSEFIQHQSDYSQRRIVCVGTLSKFKDPVTVIRAFAAVPECDSELIMIGDGSLNDLCKQEAARTGVAQRVVFTGRVDRNDIVDYMLHARCLVIGSRVDTSPNVVIEALAMGVPIVGTDAAGVPDMFRNGKEGFVVPVGDHISMADRIQKLLTNPSLARELGQNGMERVRCEHSADNVASAHISWYREMLSRETSRMKKKQ